MRFSIVVPSYNQGEYLAATLDSILQGQEGVAADVSVHDGGSTDQSVSVLRSYGDRIRWSSAPDFGQTDAINRGLRQADAEVVAYLNSDDVYLPGALAVVARHLSDHPECDLVYGDASHLHPDGSFMEAYPTASWDYDRLFQQCFLC